MTETTETVTKPSVKKQVAVTVLTAAVALAITAGGAVLTDKINQMIKNKITPSEAE